MFGLENKKKEPQEEFVFELEKELQDPVKCKEIQERIETQLQKIKENLRSGDKPEIINRLGAIFQGYASLVKVLLRSAKKK